jgi:predicted ATPase
MRYFQKRKRCGKPQCRTCQQVGGHGPYWFVSQTVGGKTVEIYVGRHLPFEAQPVIGRTEQNPFVGREQELVSLTQALEAIETLDRRREDPRRRPPTCTHAVFITGELGIGKTRLAEEVAREAQRRRWSVIWVSAPQESRLYHLWSETLRAALRQGLWKRLGVLRRPERFAPLRFLLPDILDLWTEPDRPPEQLDLWESIRELLWTISEKTTLLLVFDDLHWADRKSCELLAYLIRHLHGMRILVLGLCCEQELSSDHPLLPSLTRHPPEQEIALFPLTSLSPEQIQELIPYVPVALARQIAYHTGGNPLFAEELASRSLVGDLADTSPATTLNELPETISAVLSLRLAHLSTECQRLLECGAVLGDGFSFEAVCAVGNEILHVDEETLIDLLEEAMQAGLLLEEGSGDAIVYHFWHPLLQTYLSTQLSAARRASLHRRSALALHTHAAGREADYAAQITRHLIQSGATPERIATFAEKAALHAYTLSAYSEAASFCQQALRSIRELPFASERQVWEAALLELLAESTRIQGDAGTARAYYEQAISFHQANHATAEMEAMLWIEIGLCWFDEGNVEQAHQCYLSEEACLQEANVQGGPAWARLHYERSYLAWREGKYQDARALALNALAIFEQQVVHATKPSFPTRLRRTLAGDPVDVGRVHALIGLIALVAGQPEETAAELLQARDIYEQYHQYRELAIVYCNLGDLYLRRGMYGQAERAFERTRELAQKMDYTALISFAAGNLGVVALRQGNWSVAMTYIQQALNGAEQCNDKATMSFWSSYAAQAAIAQGLRKEARAYVVRALIYARQCQVEPYLAIALVTAASFHLASFPRTEFFNTYSGSYKKARRILQRVLSLSRIEAETRIEAQLGLAHLDLLEGDRDASQMQAQIALNEAQKHGVEWVIPQVRELLS